MNKTFRYEEEDLLGGWRIKVSNGLAHIGNIRKNPSTGMFQYYSGPVNQLNCSFEESDLENLKRRIEQK